MEKVDRLGWADGFIVAPHGNFRLGVRLNTGERKQEIVDAVVLPGWEVLTGNRRANPVLAEQSQPDKESASGTSPAVSGEVDALISFRVGGSTKRKGVSDFHLVYVNQSRMERCLDFERALQVVDEHVHLMLAFEATHRIFVHSGVVEFNGRALLLPGVSFAGKSTLVKELVAHGASYFSDEYAVLDEDGLVYPYPKSLNLRQPGSITNSDTVALTPRQLGSKAVDPKAGIPVAGVLEVKFEEGKPWDVKAISPGKSAITLFSNTISARKRTKESLATVTKVAAGARNWSGTRGEAPEAAQRILELMRD